MKTLIPLASFLCLTACSAPQTAHEVTPAPASAASQSSTYSADVWADNWFSMSINGTQVAEDSVPITTERSFNAESFSFTAERPFVIGVTAKDFKANDSGLEYIGTPRQQMGDGGIILQIFDAAKNPVAVSNAGWKCLVTHHAPTDKSCARAQDPIAGKGPCGFKKTPVPAGWDRIGFDASGWPNAAVHSVRDVRPKDGYDRINWDSSAEIIWGPDLETDNTVLCRLVVK